MGELKSETFEKKREMIMNCIEKEVPSLRVQEKKDF